VGEGLQARPILAALRSTRPEIQVLYTHFSSSAESFGRGLVSAGLADYADYLPWDTPSATARALNAVRPTVLSFSKLDVWPTLVREAAERRIALALTSATLRPGSGRESTTARRLLGQAYGRLDRVGAIDSADGERLVTLGVQRAALRVTGDTRYDQVWARAAALDRSLPWLAPLLASGRPTMVAGSTWPGDERVITAGWLGARSRFPTARLVVVPHEPTARHLEPLRRWGERSRLRVLSLGREVPSAESIRDADLILIDGVGMLGDLYAAAQIAYVGGGFHRAGLHSVLEPAAYGVPVIFGPRHQSSRDAGLLLAAGGARSVDDEEMLAAAVTRWFTDSASRTAAGSNAREVVRAGLGAVERTVEMIVELLSLARDVKPLG
jgi:3-deoxy-D-manno-octulosonic-acid transferase